jgi:hypothetical protein
MLLILSSDTFGFSRTLLGKVGSYFEHVLMIKVKEEKKVKK